MASLRVDGDLNRESFLIAGIVCVLFLLYSRKFRFSKTFQHKVILAIKVSICTLPVLL